MIEISAVILCFDHRVTPTTLNYAQCCTDIMINPSWISYLQCCFSSHLVGLGLKILVWYAACLHTFLQSSSFGFLKWRFKVLETMTMFFLTNDTWGWNRNFSLYFFTTSKLNIYSEVIVLICLSCSALIVYIWYKCIYLMKTK